MAVLKSPISSLALSITATSTPRAKNICARSHQSQPQVLNTKPTPSVSPVRPVGCCERPVQTASSWQRPLNVGEWSQTVTMLLQGVMKRFYINTNECFNEAQRQSMELFETMYSVNVYVCQLVRLDPNLEEYRPHTVIILSIHHHTRIPCLWMSRSSNSQQDYEEEEDDDDESFSFWRRIRRSSSVPASLMARPSRWS
jgi:hypothetical protein